MKLFPAKSSNFIVATFFIGAAYAEPLILEPNIQGYQSSDTIHVQHAGGKYYFDINDLSESLKFKYDDGKDSGSFLEDVFSLDSKKNKNEIYVDETGKKFYSEALLEKNLPIDMEINPLEMQLDVKSDKILPTTIKNQKAARQNSMQKIAPPDSFNNYEFDNRYFSFPLTDFTYRFNRNIYKYRTENQKSYNSNFYQTNTGLLFLGADTKLTLFGEDTGSNKLSNPRARLTAGRTLLQEPKNQMNLVKISAGDVYGANNSMFLNGASGRGVALSSFKDLVLSADKTIDISGSMGNGWEAELYLNNQLIGFRQSSIDGRYEFKNIPVNYGLNDFRVVLYGPFGEVRSEDRRYYSGTSPVKSREFGYNINAYQADRFVFESGEPGSSKSNNITMDSLFYYGVSDYLTLIGGITNTENKKKLGTDSQFGTVGAGLALNGVSLGYNTNYNFNNSEIGHHGEAQGNIYIGDIFTRYEYYGNTESPVSNYAGRDLKDLIEGRLTGQLPFLPVPYYLSYLETSDKKSDIMREVHTRLSPNFMQHYNVSIENIWASYAGNKSNQVMGLLQASFSRFRINASANYKTYPSEYLSSLGTSAEYRWDKNTFLQTGWTRELRSNYSSIGDLDSLTISMGRLFDFGGLTANASFDTDKNLSFGLTYNVSVGKIPDRYRPFINAETQMADYGTIYARIRDESGAPVSNVKVMVNGREAPSITNDTGDLLITNLQAHQKTIVDIDTNDTDDISLTAANETSKLILRPGVLRTLDINLNHMGGVEGQLQNRKSGAPFKVRINDKNKNVISFKNVDTDGSFIFDDIKYGDYTLQVLDKNDTVINQTGIIINSSFYSMKIEI